MSEIMRTLAIPQSCTWVRGRLVLEISDISMDETTYEGGGSLVKSLLTLEMQFYWPKLEIIDYTR